MKTKTTIRYCGDTKVICNCDCEKPLPECDAIKEMNALTKQHDLSTTLFNEADLFERKVIIYTFKPLDFVEKRLTECAAQCRNKAQGIQR